MASSVDEVKSTQRVRALRVRHWAITLWLDEDDPILCRAAVVEKLGSLPPGVRSLIYQLEQVPDSAAEHAGRVHVQGYLCFHQVVSAASAKRKFGYETAHLEALRAPIDVIRWKKYVQKTETRLAGTVPFHLGQVSQAGQGRRSDLATVCERIRGGARVDELVEEHSSTIVRYSRGLNVLWAFVNPPRLRSSIVVAVLWGDTGTGKSTRAWNAFPNAYPKSNEPWWPDYMGEKVVIWDEFDPTKFSSQWFCSVTDPFPRRVPCKGGHRPLGIETLIITTNADPDTWRWNNWCNASEQRAWKRRITFSSEVKTFATYVEWLGGLPGAIPTPSPSGPEPEAPASLAGRTCPNCRMPPDCDCAICDGRRSPNSKLRRLE